MKLSLLTASVLAFVVMSFSQSLETYIVQLPPTAFPELPTNLVQELQRRGCTIPQEAYSKTKPNNVIKGEFARAGQIDWAVLCSVRGVSTILCVLEWLREQSRRSCTSGRQRLRPGKW